MASAGTAVEISKYLAESVRNRKLAPGDMYPSERELCDQFTVARAQVREAMTLLQGMGLADLSKGKRPRVINPTLGQFMNGMSDTAHFFFMGSEGKAHLEQARQFLEMSVLRYAVEHATNAQIAKLVEVVDNCEQSIHDNDAFREADVRFHRVLAEIPGNPIFVALNESFVDRLMKDRPVLEDSAKRNRTSNDEHRLIVRAIADRDGEKAVEVLTRHLTRNYGAYYLRTL